VSAAIDVLREEVDLGIAMLGVGECAESSQQFLIREQ